MTWRRPFPVGVLLGLCLVLAACDLGNTPLAAPLAGPAPSSPLPAANTPAPAGATPSIMALAAPSATRLLTPPAPPAMATPPPAPPPTPLAPPTATSRPRLPAAPAVPTPTPTPRRAVPLTAAPAAPGPPLPSTEPAAPAPTATPRTAVTLPAILETPLAAGMPPAPGATAAPGAAAGTSPRAGAPVVVLDAGHGGTETGAVAATGQAEKTVNLAIVLAAATRLRADGVAVILTRDADTGVNTAGRDVNGDGTVDVDDDLQARVDRANAAGAAVLVSIHNNAQPGDSSARGTTTYYCDARPFAGASLALATSLHTHVLAAIRGAGYAGVSHGVRDDAELRKPGGHLYLLGPHNARITRPSEMPGALVETLFMSNAADLAQLNRPEMIQAVANGVADGIEAYLTTAP